MCCCFMFGRMCVCVYIHHSQFVTPLLRNCHRHSTVWRATRSYSFTGSCSVLAEHTKFSWYTLHSSHCICLSARHARRDSTILVYAIRSTWPRPIQPLPRVMGGPRTVKPRLQCQLQSTQLCTVLGLRSFVLHKSTQEWCSVVFSDKTAERCQRTEEWQWPVSTLSRRTTSSSDFWFKRNGHFFNGQDTRNSSYFTFHLKNVQHSSKKARGCILQSSHTVAWALFCNALCIMYASSMYSEATYI